MPNILYLTALSLLAIGCIASGHSESAPCVYSFMESTLEKMFKLRTRIDEWERKFAKLEDQVNDTAWTPVVAFRASLTKTISSFPKGKVLNFNIVDFNLGNGYRDGVFTARYSGTYLFSTTLGNNIGKPGEVYLMKNGKGIEYNVAGHTAGFNVGGVSTVAKLNVGDKVWVEGSGHITGHYDTSGYYSSFSGFLINRI